MHFGAYIFALIDSAVLLFIAVFYIINLSDLECDYINASVCCSRLNMAVIPELVLSSLMTLILAYCGSFGYITFTFPMVAWLIYKIMNKPRTSMSFYDPTEILNRNQLKININVAIVKLIYHLIAFFIFLYSMVLSLLSDLDSNSSATNNYLPHEM